MISHPQSIQHQRSHGDSLRGLTAARVFLPLFILAIAAGCALILANVLSSDRSNPVAVLLFISGIVLSFYALMRPWQAFLLFVWLSVCVDTLKRITYAASDMSFFDVAQILLVPVLLVGALYLRIIALHWFGPQEDITPIDYKKFLPVLGLSILAPLAMLKQSGFSFSSMAQNYTFICYMPAALALPHLLNQPARWNIFSRNMLWIGLVVGLYGMAQVIHGPFEFERVYMESGLTSTISLMDGGSFRPFSLLNTGPTFAGMMVVSALFALYRISLPVGRLRLNRSPVLAWLGFCLAVCFFSTQRGPVLCGLLVFALLPLFDRPRLLQGAFLVGVLLFALMIWRIDDVWAFVIRADESLSALSFGSAVQDRASLLTFGARVDSFHMLYDPDLWTPFGKGLSGDTGGGHDLLTNLISWIGYVGVTVFIAMMAALIGITGKLLRQLRDLDNGPALLWAQVNLAVLVYLLIWSLLFGSVIHVSPMNFFFWLAVGNLLFLHRNPDFLQPATSTEEADEPGLLVSSGNEEPTPPAQLANARR